MSIEQQESIKMSDNKIRDTIIRIGAGILALVIGIELAINNYPTGTFIEGLVIYTIMVVIAATDPSDDDDENDDNPHGGLYRKEDLDFLAGL